MPPQGRPSLLTKLMTQCSCIWNAEQTNVREKQQHLRDSSKLAAWFRARGNIPLSERIRINGVFHAPLLEEKHSTKNWLF